MKKIVIFCALLTLHNVYITAMQDSTCTSKSSEKKEMSEYAQATEPSRVMSHIAQQAVSVSDGVCKAGNKKQNRKVRFTSKNTTTTVSRYIGLSRHIEDLLIEYKFTAHGLGHQEEEIESISDLCQKRIAFTQTVIEYYKQNGLSLELQSIQPACNKIFYIYNEYIKTEKIYEKNLALTSLNLASALLMEKIEDLIAQFLSSSEFDFNRRLLKNYLASLTSGQGTQLPTLRYALVPTEKCCINESQQVAVSKFKQHYNSVVEKITAAQQANDMQQVNKLFYELRNNVILFIKIFLTDHENHAANQQQALDSKEQPAAQQK